MYCTSTISNVTQQALYHNQTSHPWTCANTKQSTPQHVYAPNQPLHNMHWRQTSYPITCTSTKRAILECGLGPNQPPHNCIRAKHVPAPHESPHNVFYIVPNHGHSKQNSNYAPASVLYRKTVYTVLCTVCTSTQHLPANHQKTIPIHTKCSQSRTDTLAIKLNVPALAIS